MSELNIISLSKTYPGGTVALNDFSLKVNDGESVALFGLERSGKSTLLRMLAGLEPVTSGQILLDGKDVTDLSAKERNVAYALQNASLDNQKSVFDNLAYGLRSRKMPEAAIEVKVKAVAEILGLSDMLTRRPKTLSSVQRRRVILGRTVVREPKVYFFDDVLSGLDGELRDQTLRDILKLQLRLGATFLYATDDITDALTVGSREAILSEGKLVQCDTPENLYNAPANEFVAEIMGVAFTPRAVEQSVAETEKTPRTITAEEA